MSTIGRLSPLDGRYESQIGGVAACLSEQALIRQRVHVEVEWLIAMGERPEIADVRPLAGSEVSLLRSWVTTFDEAQALRVKAIEETTQHDVKAVEYYVKERMVTEGSQPLPGAP